MRKKPLGKTEVPSHVLETHHARRGSCVFTSVSPLILGFQNVSVDISECNFGVEEGRWQVGLPPTERQHRDTNTEAYSEAKRQMKIPISFLPLSQSLTPYS